MTMKSMVKIVLLYQEMSPSCIVPNSSFVFKKCSVLVSYQLRTPVPSLPRNVLVLLSPSCSFLETSCLVLYQFVSWGFAVKTVSNGLEIRGLYNIPSLPFPSLPPSLPSPFSPPQVPQGAGEAQAPWPVEAPGQQRTAGRCVAVRRWHGRRRVQTKDFFHDAW